MVKQTWTTELYANRIWWRQMSTISNCLTHSKSRRSRVYQNFENKFDSYWPRVCFFARFYLLCRLIWLYPVCLSPFFVKFVCEIWLEVNTFSYVCWYDSEIWERHLHYMFCSSSWLIVRKHDETVQEQLFNQSCHFLPLCKWHV